MTRRHGEQVSPRSRYDLHQLVAAAPGEQPLAAGGLMSQLMHHQLGASLPVDAELKVGQRVKPVAVAAVLADQHLWPEGAQQRRYHRVERPQPASVAGARGQRHVDRVTAASACPGL